VRPRAAHLARGDDAESAALADLEARGMTLIERNFRCKVGEIDLICEDRGTLVFVEVRYRRNANFGAAAETIGYRKQARIIRAARYFLLRHARLAERPMRFDVIAIEGLGNQRQLTWIPDAFQT
jgi:putative endonuclease